MATKDSKYYYDKYKKEKSAVKTSEKNIKALEKILDALTDDTNDEIRAVNKELDALKDDLKDSVRHNASFTRSANDCSSQKEKGVTLDTHLSVCVKELEEEIRSLKTKKKEDAEDRDYYKKKCKEKLEEEGKPSWTYIF